jgi:hypothetical protein
MWWHLIAIVGLVAVIAVLLMILSAYANGMSR